MPFHWGFKNHVLILFCTSQPLNFSLLLHLTNIPINHWFHIAIVFFDISAPAWAGTIGINKLNNHVVAETSCQYGMDKPECSGVAFQHVAVGFGAQWCKTCGAHPSELDRFYWFYWPIIPWHIFHQFSIRHLVSRWGSINKSTELLQFLERISNILFKKNVGHDEKKYKCWKSIFRIFFARWQEMCHHRGLVRFLFLKYFFTTSQTMPTTPLRWIIHHIVLVHVGCSYGGQTRRFKIQLSLGSLDFDVKLHHVPIRHSIGLKDFSSLAKQSLWKRLVFRMAREPSSSTSSSTPCEATESKSDPSSASSSSSAFTAFVQTLWWWLFLSKTYFCW